MLIQALCEYHDTLAAKGKLVPEGYSAVDISYLISLTPDGKMDAILDWRRPAPAAENKKQKEIMLPRSVCLPKRTEKTAIEANVIEHRPLYIFGLNYDAAASTFSHLDGKSKAIKSHDACVKRNLGFLEGLRDPICIAYAAFLRGWRPEDECENPHLLPLGKAYATARFAFCLSGRPDILLHECPALKQRWESEAAAADGGAHTLSQCGILGRSLPIARIHDKIKKVPGGTTTGNTLISFNNPSEYSYGREQSFNSNVSEAAMVKYTQSLNYLMENNLHRTRIGELIVFHWAASGDEGCDTLFNMLNFSETMDAEKTEEAIGNIIERLHDGVVLADVQQLLRDIDPSVSFYIAGFKPNSTRLAVKFVYRQRFGAIVQNLLQHQLDMKLRGGSKPISIWRICNELVSPKSSHEEVDPSAMAKLLNAILNGYKYPDSLFAAMVRRIRTDSDEENKPYIKMNPVRMGFLKAYINRDNRFKAKEEEIKMALDESNTNPAYLCGRLFAVLENIQQKASNYSLNRTILDAYFASASARPAMVFPRLISLAQHHLNKLDNPRYDEAEIQDILAMMGTAFPGVLPLKEQGVFMLGYYQQKHHTDERKKEYRKAKEEE